MVGDEFVDLSSTIFKRLKVLPIYCLSSAFKCFSIATLSAYMHWYTFIPLAFIASTLLLTHYILRRNTLRQPDSTHKTALYKAVKRDGNNVIAYFISHFYQNGERYNFQMYL